MGVSKNSQMRAHIRSDPHVWPDLFKPYQHVRESNCLTNFLDQGCFATQNLVGDNNQFLAKITKPPPAEITKPNHVLASTGTGFHKSVKQCKSLRCWEVKLSPWEVPRILLQLLREL